jgi:hypothetical protein
LNGELRSFHHFIIIMFNQYFSEYLQSCTSDEFSGWWHYFQVLSSIHRNNEYLIPY